MMEHGGNSTDLHINTLKGTDILGQSSAYDKIDPKELFRGLKKRSL